MIERFNFYDIYGYLIPGTVWLALTALPYHVIFHFRPLSPAELAAGLVAAYVAGHFLSGFGRRVLPSARYSIRDPGKPERHVQLSEALLADGYAGKKLTPTLKNALRTQFERRFGFWPADDPTLLFFMCRTALTQAKAGSYVEQYHGLTSMTKNLAVGTMFIVAFYSSWIAISALREFQTRSSLGQLLPLAALGAGLGAAHLLPRMFQKLFPVVSEKGSPGRDWRDPAGLAFVLLFCATGAVSAWWFPLQSRQGYQLALAASILTMLYAHLISATVAFDQSLSQSTYRDFVVLTSIKSHPGSTAHGME